MKSQWYQWVSAVALFLVSTFRPQAQEADGGTSDGLADDILAAYSHALQWYVTGNSAHARKAIEILNGWANVLTKINNKPTEYFRQEVLVAPGRLSRFVRQQK